MAVSVAAVSEVPVLLPNADQPIARINGIPVYLDPAWRRSLQAALDRQQKLIELTNAIRTEVNLHHP